MAQDLSRRIRISNDVLFREIDGEAVLLNIRTGVYFGMDPVGTRIWRILEKKKRLNEILDHMLQEFDVDRRTCEQDLLEFTARLEKHDLVSVENG